MNRSNYCLAFLVWVLPAWAQPSPPQDISQGEILKFISESAGCESLEHNYISHLEYFDFTGEGEKQAVVVAGTCMTGTAGPDVHSVFARASDGKLVELPFRRVEEDPERKQKLPVFGNPNYGLKAEDGMLVARWLDSSDRHAPLTVWYRWTGKEFAVERMQAEGPFPTSYDCSKATEEVDHAICYSPSVAALDVQLGEAYRARLTASSADQKRRVREQQREWLALRGKKCVIYKWWVGCLTAMYKERIAELKRP